MDLKDEGIAALVDERELRLAFSDGGYVTPVDDYQESYTDCVRQTIPPPSASSLSSAPALHDPEIKAMPASELSDPKIPLRILLAYSIGDIGMAASLATISYLKMLFLLDVALLPAGAVAVFIFLSTIWDAATDLLFGSLSDNTISIFGRRRPYLLMGAIAYAGFFYAFFQSPFLPTFATDQLVGREFYYFICYLLYKTAGTVYQVPYYAMVPEITSSYNERTKLIGARSLISSILSLGVLPLVTMIIAAFPLKLYPSQPDLQLGFSVAAAIFIPLIIIPAVIVFTQIKEPSLPPAPKIPLSFKAGFLALIKNRAFLCTLGVLLTSLVANSLVANNLALWCKYVLRKDQYLATLLMTLQGFSIISIILWVPISSFISKQYALMISVFVYIVGVGSSWFYSQTTDIGWIFFSFAVAGLGGGGLALFPSALLAECVDLDELSTGKRREGLFFGIFVFCGKLVLAVALTLSNTALAALGYINHLPGSTDPYYQPSAVLLAFRIMMVPVGCGLCLLRQITGYFY